MTAPVVYLLSLAGFVALCLSSPRHQQDLLKRALPVPTARALRAMGYGAIAAAFATAGAGNGLGLGLVIFTGVATIAAATVVGFITWRTSRAKTSGVRRPAA